MSPAASEQAPAECNESPIKKALEFMELGELLEKIFMPLLAVLIAFSSIAPGFHEELA